MPTASLPALADTTPVAKAAVVAAAALLRALLQESTHARPLAWSLGLNLTTLPSYQQLRGLGAAERLALATQAAAQLRQRAATKPA